MNQNYSGQERRKYLRIPFQKDIKYRICYNKFTTAPIQSNDISVEADTQNISEGGIFFMTKYPPPTLSVISIDVDVQRLREYLIKENLTNALNPDNLYVKNGQLHGEVVRIQQCPHSGYYSVALKLISKTHTRK
jgi:hypothetical protein